MMIGDVNGIMENNSAVLPLGALMATDWAMMKLKTNGRVMGSMNWEVSVSWFTAAPIAANILAYSR